MSGARSPRVARLLVKLTTEPSEREFVLGDMEQEYAGLHRSAGRLAARRWYWIHALRTSVAAAGPGPGRRQRGSGARRRAAQMFDPIRQDTLFALRSFRRSPGFTAVALASLALGIGANTAIFSLVNGVLIRALPYADANELVSLREYSLERGAPSRGDPNGRVAYPNFLDWKSQVEAFSDLAASTSSRYLLLDGETPKHVWGAPATTNYFDFLGVPAAIGRAFMPGESDAVVVLSDGLWRRGFGAAPDVVGRSIRLDDVSFEVVGVMPPGFRLPYHQEELWLPVERAPRNFIINGMMARNRFSFYAIGRLAPGATLERAETELQLVVERLRREYADTNEGTGLQLVPLHETRVGRIRPTLLMLFGAVGLLSLIACVNVANLLLARATVRRRETAVRAALGAGRWRITRLFLTESTMLSLAGGAVGLLLAHWSVRAIRAMSAGDIPRIDEVGIDLNVLAFTFLVSLAAGWLSGLAPALRATRLDLDAALRGGGQVVRGSVSGKRMHDTLVVSEVALALVLLLGAGLLVNSFRYLWTFEPGFDPRGVLVAEIHPERSKYPDRVQSNAFYQLLYERLRGLPEVESVGGVGRLPGTIPEIVVQIRREAGDVETVEEPLALAFSTISGDYFETMRIPLLAGRFFRDDESGVVVVNEALAERLWPEGGAVGRHISTAFEPPVSLEIVGVVGNQRFTGLAPVSQPELFVPPESELGGASGLAVVVRTSGDPAQIAGAVREAVRAIDAEQPIASIATMEQSLADTMAQPLFYMAMFSLFGALALALSAAGIFGVAAYSVTQRVHELGVRIALGAGRGDLLKLVVGRGALLVTIGIVIGAGAARALTRYVESLVYGITPTDLSTFVSVSVGMAAVAIVAFWLPGRRAAAVDPIVALRRD